MFVWFSGLRDCCYWLGVGGVKLAISYQSIISRKINMKADWADWADLVSAKQVCRIMSSSSHNLFSVQHQPVLCTQLRPGQKGGGWCTASRPRCQPARFKAPSRAKSAARAEPDPSALRESQFSVLSSEHRNGNYLLLFVSWCGIFCAVMGGVVE